jgi:hypothetical protein
MAEKRTREVGVTVRDFGDCAASGPASSYPTVILNASGWPPRILRPNMLLLPVQLQEVCAWRHDSAVSLWRKARSEAVLKESGSGFRERL